MFKGTCCVQLTVQVDKLAQETNRDTGRKRKRIHHVVVQGHAHVPALLFVCAFPVCVLFVYPTLKLKVRAPSAHILLLQIFIYLFDSLCWTCAINPLSHSHITTLTLRWTRGQGHLKDRIVRTFFKRSDFFYFTKNCIPFQLLDRI